MNGISTDVDKIFNNLRDAGMSSMQANIISKYIREVFNIEYPDFAKKTDIYKFNSDLKQDLLDLRIRMYKIAFLQTFIIIFGVSIIIAIME